MLINIKNKINISNLFLTILILDPVAIFRVNQKKATSNINISPILICAFPKLAKQISLMGIVKIIKGIHVFFRKNVTKIIIKDTVNKGIVTGKIDIFPINISNDSNMEKKIITIKMFFLIKVLLLTLFSIF